MNTILLILCNALSCFIISTILFQFMNRYCGIHDGESTKKIFRNA